MNDENYRKALDDARAEMTPLLEARARIDARLTQLKSTIDVLSGLVQEGPKLEQDEGIETLDSLGISEAVRQMLRDSGGLTPIQLKTRLIEEGFDLDRYANPGAVIYNTLKRLETQGEIVPVRDSSGVTAYTMRPTVAEEIASDFGKGIAKAMLEVGTSIPALAGLQLEATQRDSRKNWFAGPKTKELKNLRAKQLIEKHLAEKG